MPAAGSSPLNTYLEHLEKGELAYQFSPEAGKAVYPRVLCPFTGSVKLEWRVSKGLGTVYSTTVAHPAKGDPYNVALIDCDEGFRLMSRVEDIDPMQVKIGQRVRFRVHRPAARSRPVPYLCRRASDGRLETRQRGDRRRRRIRYRTGGGRLLRHRPDRRKASSARWTIAA